MAAHPIPSPEVREEGEAEVMLKELDSFDWQEVFKPEYATPSVPVPCAPVPIGTFTRDDVAELYGQVDGDNDGPTWIAYGKLADGRYFFIEAGCDYTGWG